MKYLADTHILLWAIEDDEKLPAAARDIFLDEKYIEDTHAPHC